MDIYIEKIVFINDEIDMLCYLVIRLFFECWDVIVVVFISCIYGLGILLEYLKVVIFL